MADRNINFSTRVGLSIISNKWYALTLSHLDGPTPFMDLRTAIRGISTFNFLQELANLERMGLLTDEDFVYQLTPQGTKVKQALSQIERLGTLEIKGLSAN